MVYDIDDGDQVLFQYRDLKDRVYYSGGQSDKFLYIYNNVLIALDNRVWGADSVSVMRVT